MTQKLSVLIVKRQVLLIDSPHQLQKAGSLILNVDGTVLEFQTELKNVGVIFDSSLSFDPHMQYTVKNSLFVSEILLDYALCYPFL